LRSSEKLPYRNVSEEPRCLIKKDKDDAESDENGREGAQEKNPFDRPLFDF
jgi:hypothetical protein